MGKQHRSLECHQWFAWKEWRHVFKVVSAWRWDVVTWLTLLSFTIYAISNNNPRIPVIYDRTIEWRMIEIKNIAYLRMWANLAQSQYLRQPANKSFVRRTLICTQQTYISIMLIWKQRGYPKALEPDLNTSSFNQSMYGVIKHLR